MQVDVTQSRPGSESPYAFLSCQACSALRPPFYQHSTQILSAGAALLKNPRPFSRPQAFKNMRATDINGAPGCVRTRRSSSSLRIYQLEWRSRCCLEPGA